MHMVHGLGQEMSMEKCLAPHLFEESKNFLRRNLPRHTNDQDKQQRGGGGECHLFGFLIFHLALRRSQGRLGRALLTCELHGSCEVGRGYQIGLSADECYLNIPCPSD